MADTFRPLNASRAGDEPSSSSDLPQPEQVPARELPGALEFVDAGFEPLEELTGVTWIGEHWPAEHRRSLTETRSENLAFDHDVVWFVRSPWPSLTAAEAISLVWAHLPREDENAWPAVAQQILSWTEHQARREQP
jgi:hypothetical protein